VARPSNKEQRRIEIAQALLAFMAEKGYAGATVREIAKAAGVSSGLIHHHFESKQDILLAAVKLIVAAGQARYEAMSAEATTAKGKIEAFINSRLSLGEGENLEAVKAWVLIGSEAVRQDEVQSIYKDAIAQQQKFLSKLLADADGNKLSRKEYQSQAAIILSAIEGAYLLGVTCEGVLPKGFAAKALEEFIK